MHKVLSLMAATMFAAMALITSSTDADARRYRHSHGAGAAIAAAVIGGIILHKMHRRHHRRHYYSYYDGGYGYNYYPRQRYYHSGFRHHRHYGGQFNNYAGVPGLRPRHHGHWRY
jgi:hypothetical protein